MTENTFTNWFGDLVSHPRVILDAARVDAKIRSTYGTFGIIHEATYRIRPLSPMKVYHETFDVDEFAARIPELRAREESFMYYLFPFGDKITVEFRVYNPEAKGEPNQLESDIRRDARNRTEGVRGAVENLRGDAEDL